MKTLKELQDKVNELLNSLDLIKHIEITERLKNENTVFSIILYDNDEVIEYYLFVSECTLERVFLRLEFELKMKLLK